MTSYPTTHPQNYHVKNVSCPCIPSRGLIHKKTKYHRQQHAVRDALVSEILLHLNEHAELTHVHQNRILSTSNVCIQEGRHDGCENNASIETSSTFKFRTHDTHILPSSSAVPVIFSENSQCVPHDVLQAPSADGALIKSANALGQFRFISTTNALGTIFEENQSVNEHSAHAAQE